MIEDLASFPLKIYPSIIIHLARDRSKNRRLIYSDADPSNVNNNSYASSCTMDPLFLLFVHPGETFDLYLVYSFLAKNLEPQR